MEEGHSKRISKGDDGSNSCLLENLPDEVLVKILSLLQTREVIRTSILSWRWRNLWKLVPTLNFDYESHMIPSLFTSPRTDEERDLFAATSIGNLLSSILSPRVSSVSIANLPDQSGCITGLFNSLIEFSVRQKVEDLALMFRTVSCSFYMFKLPIKIFYVTSLATLSLIGCEIELTQFSSVNLPLLKTLHFCRVKINRKDIEALISKCPSLEFLSLEFFEQYDMEANVSIDHPKLVSLYLNSNKLIKLKTPALKFLELKNWSDSLFKDEKSFIFEDVSSLISCTFLGENEASPFQIKALRDALLNDLGHVRTFWLTSKFFQDLSGIENDLTHSVLGCTSLILDISDNGVLGVGRILPLFSMIKKLTFVLKGEGRFRLQWQYWDYLDRTFLQMQELKETLDQMQDLKEVEIRNFIFCYKGPFVHWMSEFDEQRKLLDVVMATLVSLRTLTIYVSEEMKLAPASFMQTFLNDQIKKIQDFDGKASKNAVINLRFL